MLFIFGVIKKSNSFFNIYSSISCPQTFSAWDSRNNSSSLTIESSKGKYRVSSVDLYTIEGITQELFLEAWERCPWRGTCNSGNCQEWVRFCSSQTKVHFLTSGQMAQKVFKCHFPFTWCPYSMAAHEIYLDDLPRHPVSIPFCPCCTQNARLN